FVGGFGGFGGLSVDRRVVTPPTLSAWLKKKASTKLLDIAVSRGFFVGGLWGLVVIVSRSA
ncbi:hypothetical protein Q4488_18580, partial [Amphritea sp. 1_MG-2023]|uniref:hypothetical protein n=1 Tax=Amphritea sp. 1_MG-2023 TaxID=3062670 RepID=UPI0026E36E87